LLDQKLESIKRVLAREQERGVFPILGYSYYEYAQSLREDDPFSALIFGEYALELGDLDRYFPKQKRKEPMNGILKSEGFSLLITGIIIGLGIGAIINIISYSIYRRKRGENPKKTSVRGLPGKKR
jgi:hypothetical protein